MRKFLNSSDKCSRSASRRLAYLLTVVMCLLQVVVNTVASAQMQIAQDNAGENTLVICTGKGMVYINEALFLDAGIIEYISVDETGSVIVLDGIGIDTELVSSCIFAAQADCPQHTFEFQQAESNAQVRAIANFTVKQDNYLRDGYLCSLSRGPPTAV